MCFRSRSGLHRVPEGCHSDARRSPVGGALLLHAAAARTGQSGEVVTSFLSNIMVIIIIFTQVGENYLGPWQQQLAPVGSDGGLAGGGGDCCPLLAEGQFVHNSMRIKVESGHEEVL